MRRPFTFTKTSERRSWSGLLAQGLTVHAVAQAVGRAPKTVQQHADPGMVHTLRRRALRDERLFAACNRALAEAAR